MCQEKPHIFFIHLPRFLAFSDCSAYRRHPSVPTSYFGEGIDPPIPFDQPCLVALNCLYARRGQRGHAAPQRKTGRQVMRLSKKSGLFSELALLCFYVRERLFGPCGIFVHPIL